MKNIQKNWISLSLAVLSVTGLEAQNKPNVLFILADDLGCRDLSCTGSKYYETPNIDRIAREGVVFTNGYAACQVSSPSRASILTGQFTARHGITDWIGSPSGEAWRGNNRYTRLLPAEYQHELAKTTRTLPEALREAGYATLFAGKWHLGSKGSWPEDHGFDLNVGGWDSGSPNGGYFSPYANPNLPDGPQGEELSMRLANEMIRMIRENNLKSEKKPFFAYLSFYAVHGPIETTKSKWSKYRDKAQRLGEAQTGYKMGKRLPIRQVQDNPVYAGLVEAMDDAVGVVLKALEEMKLDKNTIIVFTSDNGGVCSGDAFSTSNLPYRGGKGTQFEGGIREPYFIKVPGERVKIKKTETPVIGTDFFPTILELTGQPLRPEEHLDGVSLVPLLEGKSLNERPLIWHYPHYGNQGGDPCSMIRLGDWKLIHYYEDGHDELYNLKKDIGEATDLAAKFPVKKDELHQSLFDYLTKVKAKFPQTDSGYDKEREAMYLKEVAGKQLPNLEKQRKNMLSPDFNPKNHWWGSQTND